MQNSTNHIKAASDVEAYKTYQRFINADETLAAEMIERQTNQQASERLAMHAYTKEGGRHFAATLKARGVDECGIEKCKSAITEPLIGVSANNAKMERMSRLELVASMFAEEVAIERINTTNAKGNSECERHSREAGEETKAVICKSVT